MSTLINWGTSNVMDFGSRHFGSRFPSGTNLEQLEKWACTARVTAARVTAARIAAAGQQEPRQPESRQPESRQLESRQLESRQQELRQPGSRAGSWEQAAESGRD